MRFLYLISLLVVVACTGDEPGNSAVQLEREVEQQARSQVLWPDFEPMSIPLAIYDGHRTTLFRHPEPPDGFQDRRSELAGAYVYNGRHPAIVANTNAEIGGIPTATIMMTSFDGERDLADLASVAIHEKFHVRQSLSHPSWRANEADLFVYPIDDPDLLAIRRLETETFKKAIEERDIERSACWARIALDLRFRRFEQMDSVFAAYERNTELNEGLSTYVELRAKGNESVSFEEGGFKAADVRRRAYTTGSALALLLDRFHPGWKSAFDLSDHPILDAALDSILSHTTTGMASPCSISEADELAAQRAARADVDLLLTELAERREAFDARPGFKVIIEATPADRLWPQGFDPLNVIRIKTDVLHLRFLRLGNNAGSLEAIDGEEADIEVLTEGFGPHPLYNGVRRVVITGLQEPNVHTDSDSLKLEAPGAALFFRDVTVRQEADSIIVQLNTTP